MTRITRSVLLAALAGFGLITAQAFADTPVASGTSQVQTPAKPDAAKGKQCPHARMWRRHAAHMRAEHTRLHEALKLDATQEKAWQTFTAGTAPRKGMFCRTPAVGKTAPERMEAMLTMMRRHVQHTRKRLDAVKTFYAVLTPAQQKIFDENFRPHGFGHPRAHAKPAAAKAAPAAAPKQG